MAASTWWPTPTAPSKWFTADQIATSQAFHRPPAAMTGISLGVSVVLTIGLTFLFRATSNQVLHWVLTPVVLGTPWIVNQWWCYTRHRASFGIPAPPVAQIIRRCLTSTALVFIAVNISWILFRYLGTGVGSLVVGLFAVTGVNILLSILDLHQRGEKVDADSASPFMAIADWANVRCDFWLTPVNESGGRHTTSDTNAQAIRHRGTNTVLLSPGLLGRAADVQSLVVAHEIAHLRLGHPSKLKVFMVAQTWVSVGLVWLLSYTLRADLDESWVYPLLATGYVGIWLLLRPAAAFVKRHFERDADKVSYELLGNVPTLVARQVHGTKFANLNPSTIQLLLAEHPPPAERLELISRRIPTL